MVGLGDSPGVTTEIWNKVAEVDADLASARYDGELRPPVRLSASMWPSLPVSGDDGARALMRQRPDLVRPVPVDGDRAISTRSRTSAGGAERLVHRRLSDR